MASPKRVLIAGAGVAGPSLAWFLAHNGHNVTIVERAPALRTSGQQVDVAGKGVHIVKAMGIWDELLAHSTGDQGIKFVDEHDKIWAAFPVDKESGASSFVKEIEILRGEMAEVLYRHTKGDVDYVFGEQIRGLKEQAKQVTVSFAKGADRDFDVVVAADGLFSKTRDIAFSSSFAHVKSLKQCCALMSIPYKESDGYWSRWYNAPGGRCVVLRPQPKIGKTGAYLAVMTPHSGKLALLPHEAQISEFTQLFADAGWEAERVLREMKDNPSVYVQETAQVKTPSWVRGRIALLGDAGYCPSPVSGQGTTLAFVGAYILAGCLCTYDEVETALKQYEQQIKPFVEKAQALIPGVPGIANPQTSWGIAVLYTVLWWSDLIAKSGVPGWIGKLMSPVASLVSGKELEIPTYPAMSTRR
ncbi:hypothetical protein BAUCODRAFT_453277 [Baudoinia panamericana UAMH 10762]|uniref:FAD-binding domain-containing protein n=1 Tax=Baudoinia panamericana (strain UAMH 10762) TaxID=717646 RepID=M2LSL6_BAUPA|nr:uncharacterized protein BAUCODRAFT_453277 [Baudoinia panamericana UAMH 10762]EMC97472.1 hypothetical protein BAUCODRAFT_453277 [Baudoinia panamericana UAMH 10762]